MSDSHLHDTRPELMTAIEVLEEISPHGWGITGQDFYEVGEKKYSVDRTITRYREQAKAVVLIEIHGNHDVPLPDRDLEKSKALLTKYSLVDIILNPDRIKKWKEQIRFCVEDALDQAERGKKVYRAIYYHNNALTITETIGEF